MVQNFGMSKPDDVVRGAIRRLAAGDGKGSLKNLGIQRAQAIADANVASGVIDTFGSNSTDPVGGVVARVLDEVLKEELRLLGESASRYRDYAEFVADGAGRATLAKAIAAQERLYGAVAEADPLTRARERAYFLSVALCDIDERFRNHLLGIQTGFREQLFEVYTNLLEATNREPVYDVERIELVVSALFEGASMLQRISAGRTALQRQPVEIQRLALSGDALFDAILRVAIALSRPKGGVGIDPDAILFRGESSAVRTATEAVVHRADGDLYDVVTDEIAQLGTDETILHCSLHRSMSAQPHPRSSQGARLKQAMRTFARAGGRLENLEQIGSKTEFEETLELLRTTVAGHQDVTFRVLILDAPVTLCPLIIGNRIALLGRANDGAIVDGIAFRDESGRRWCRDHAEALWREPRGYTILTPSGFNERGIADARRHLEACERAGT